MIGKNYKIALVTILVVAIGGVVAYRMNKAGPGKGQTFGQMPGSFEHPDFLAISTGVVDVEGGMSKVSANRDGVIKQVMVREGDHVDKEDVLALQEDEAERINLELAKIRLESQKAQNERLKIKIKTDQRELERITPLFKLGAVTQAEFDRANDAILQNQVDKKVNRANLFASEVEVKRAEFTLSQKIIRAPLSGRVVSVEARPGVGASTLNVSTLFTIIPDAPRIVRAEVDDTSMNDVYVGQKAQIISNVDRRKSYNATVSVVSKFFEIDAGQSRFFGGGANGQSIDVILALADDAVLLIGQKVQVRFLRDKNALVKTVKGRTNKGKRP